MVFISAATGFNIEGLLKTARELHVQANYRATTGELNRIIERSSSAAGRVRAGGRRLPKIYYATQTSVEPPTIVFFVSDPEAFDANYVRYVENSLRKELPFTEVPLKIVFRQSKGPEGPGKPTEETCRQAACLRACRKKANGVDVSQL